MIHTEVIEARPWHCGALSRSMRVDHHKSLLAMGVNVHHGITSALYQSYYAKSLKIDGHLSAMGGLMGTPLSPTATVWLVVAQAAMKHPRVLIKVMRRQLDAMMLGKMWLETTIVADDEVAQRFAAFLGFYSPDGFGPQAHTRIERRNLVRHLRTTPDLMIPVGSTGYQIGIIYRPEIH